MAIDKLGKMINGKPELPSTCSLETRGQSRFGLASHMLRKCFWFVYKFVYEYICICISWISFYLHMLSKCFWFVYKFGGTCNTLWCQPRFFISVLKVVWNENKVVLNVKKVVVSNEISKLSGMKTKLSGMKTQSCLEWK